MYTYNKRNISNKIESLSTSIKLSLMTRLLGIEKKFKQFTHQENKSKFQEFVRDYQ